MYSNPSRRSSYQFAASSSVASPLSSASLPRLCVHVHVVDAHDARMRQTREEPSFDLESLAQELDFAVVERERLQRKARTKPFVLDLVHLGHSTLPERTHDAIGSNLSSSLKHSA